MSESLTKKTVTPDTFKPGDVLVNRTDSTRTARVVEAIKRDNKFTGFLVVFNNGKQGKLSKFDLEKDSCPWVLRGTPIEPAFEYDAKDVEIMKKESEELAESLNLVPAIKEPEYDADKAERDHLTSEAYGSDDDSVVETVPDGETDSTPEWNEVEQLRKELEAANNLLVLRDNKITELRAALDNLIDAQMPSAEHSAAQDDRNAELQARVEELENSLHAACQEIEEHRKDASEARAELALSKVPAELKPVAAADVTAAPQQEICVARDITQQQFTDRINDGWSPLHMQFMKASGEDYRDELHVIFIKTMPAVPVAPEPHKAVEAIPGTHIVFPAPASTSYEQAHAGAMEFAANVMQESARAYSSLPRPRINLGLPAARPALRTS